MQIIQTLTGLKISAQLIKDYEKGRLFFAQERLILTDLSNIELNSLDIISFVEEII